MPTNNIYWSLLRIIQRLLPGNASRSCASLDHTLRTPLFSLSLEKTPKEPQNESLRKFASLVVTSYTIRTLFTIKVHYKRCVLSTKIFATGNIIILQIVIIIQIGRISHAHNNKKKKISNNRRAEKLVARNASNFFCSYHRTDLRASIIV